MSQFLQQGDDTGLLHGSQLRKHGSLPYFQLQFFIRQPLYLRTVQRTGRIDSHLTADGTYNRFVITGQHFHIDSMAMELPDGIGCRRFGRVEKSEITDQHHSGFVFDRKIMFFFYPTLLCHRQHTHTFFVHLLTDDKGFPPQLIGQLVNGFAELCMSADCKHLLYRSLGDDLTLPLFVFHHHGHTSAGKVEWDFVYLGISIPEIIQL